MSLNQTELSELVSRSMVQALSQLTIPERVSETMLEMVKLVATHQFWLKRTADDMAALWDQLRQNDQLFYTFMRAFNIFRLGYELNSGELFDVLVERLIRLQEGLVFTDAENRTLVDDEYLQTMRPPEGGRYDLMLKANHWFAFLLLLEMTAWGLKLVARPAGGEETDPAGE